MTVHSPAAVVRKGSVLLPLALGLLLAGCQQPKQRDVDVEEIHRDPPAISGACPALVADWLQRMPSAERRIEPADCTRLAATPLFAWGEPKDRMSGTPFVLNVRRAGGAVVSSRTGLLEPRARLDQALSVGDYEWAVSYTSTSGNSVNTQWRRFGIEQLTRTLTSNLGTNAQSSANATSAFELPDGQAMVSLVAARSRPRMLAAGSSYAAIRSASLQGDHLPVLAALRSRCSWLGSLALPTNPDTANSATARNLVQTARTERFNIETLALVGQLDSNATLLAQAKARLLSLAAWSPSGLSSEEKAVQANREIYLALAQGIDLLGSTLTSSERSTVALSLRARVLKAANSLSLLDRVPYDAISQTNLRYITQALMLSLGLAEFPEAQAQLVRFWDLNLSQANLWSSDGSFGNGIAYAWYNLNSAAPFAAAVRVISGVNLYRLSHYARMGEQLIAFTAPNWPQTSAFGDEQENRQLYDFYSPSSYRLHAQQTRSPLDAWYWQAKPGNLSKPSDVNVWQLLLLGADNSPLPAPSAPSVNDWFSPDTGLAALHMDIKRGDRTSVFFRASRHGLYAHSQADQNALVYVSQGQPLLVNAGYYPYYNSPHHKNTRASRFKNTLSFDGGFGQSENAANLGVRPGDPIQSMDANGALIRTQSLGTLSAVTGDATAAYRALDLARFVWRPTLSNAVRSVVMDKANGVTLVYDWATSDVPRQWELNFHSPNSFAVNAATVSAQNGGASVCMDRYGPATGFSQTQAWEVAPETNLPAQAHARFATLSKSVEFAHLMVLRDGCRNLPVQVTQSGTLVSVVVAGRQIAQFDKRALGLTP
ncbi:hypothetical protein HNQ51_001664 [Inhella inkyongensis]|uniref:Heparinase II/III-like C-terminal domain-containing protein n=1 Tax=Inhella inkyongensis TaxID=392593 RepID=A0A840S7B6_9BURK|nr:heparinase II/III family protein [Inhella inkyongensis]MBB5204350.1 hypothetical protein [Inhella inkyongensis]